MFQKPLFFLSRLVTIATESMPMPVSINPPSTVVRALMKLAKVLLIGILYLDMARFAKSLPAFPSACHTFSLRLGQLQLQLQLHWRAATAISVRHIRIVYQWGVAIIHLVDCPSHSEDISWGPWPDRIQAKSRLEHSRTVTNRTDTPKSRSVETFHDASINTDTISAPSRHLYRHDCFPIKRWNATRSKPKQSYVGSHIHKGATSHPHTAAGRRNLHAESGIANAQGFWVLFRDLEIAEGPERSCREKIQCKREDN